MPQFSSPILSRDEKKWSLTDLGTDLQRDRGCCAPGLDHKGRNVGEEFKTPGGQRKQKWKGGCLLQKKGWEFKDGRDTGMKTFNCDAQTMPVGLQIWKDISEWQLITRGGIERMRTFIRALRPLKSWLANSTSGFQVWNTCWSLESSNPQEGDCGRSDASTATPVPVNASLNKTGICASWTKCSVSCLQKAAFFFLSCLQVVPRTAHQSRFVIVLYQGI